MWTRIHQAVKRNQTSKKKNKKSYGEVLAQRNKSNKN